MRKRNVPLEMQKNREGHKKQQGRNISMLFLILTVLILNYFLSCYRMYTRSCLKIAFRHLHDPAIRQMPDSNV